MRITIDEENYSAIYIFEGMYSQGIISASLAVSRRLDHVDRGM
jgi:hypothetical protein